MINVEVRVTGLESVTRQLTCLPRHVLEFLAPVLLAISSPGGQKTDLEVVVDGQRILLKEVRCEAKRVLDSVLDVLDLIRQRFQPKSAVPPRESYWGDYPPPGSSIAAQEAVYAAQYDQAFADPSRHAGTPDYSIEDLPKDWQRDPEGGGG